MRSTWYILEDGTVADPNECSPDESGRLVHSGGQFVAMRGQVPSSTGVDLDDAGKLLFGGKGDHDGDGKAGGAAKPKDMQAAKPRTGYKTRQTKTR